MIWVSVIYLYISRIKKVGCDWNFMISCLCLCRFEEPRRELERREMDRGFGGGMGGMDRSMDRGNTL